MLVGTPSETAYTAACHRAVHQQLDKACVFNDPLAIQIVGEQAVSELVGSVKNDVDKRKMRFLIAMRSRFMEDALRASISGGLGQVVVLGAGLDTLAYRSTVPDHIRIFEVDHPATQAWKRERLKAADIGEPENVKYAPIDFEHQSLADGLNAAGFNDDEPTFFSCLGVVPYLETQTFFDLLRFIAGVEGSHIVFDYGEPVHMRTTEAQSSFEKRSAHVATLGEPWITFFEPASLHSRMREIGFTQFEDVTPFELLSRFLPGRPANSSGSGAHVLFASV